MIVYIKTTEMCNFHCLHCYNPPESKKLDFQLAYSFLGELNAIEPCVFVYHGGEPMLGDTSKMLSLMEHFDKTYWRISTNLGYDLTPERKKLLLRMKQIRVSFDVGIRFGSIVNLLKWYRNIQWLIKHTGNVYMNICLSTALLKHDPIDLLKMLDTLRIKQYAFERIANVGAAQKHSEIIPTYKEVDDWLCKIYELERRNQFQCRCQDIQNIRLGIQNHPEQCYGKQCCTRTLTINADGTIGNCPNNAKENIVATTNDKASNVVEVIRGEKHIPKQQCLLCKWFIYCRGGCEQQEWQGNMCPYPKQLAKIILGEQNCT